MVDAPREASEGARPAWVDGPIDIDAALLREVEAHAVAEYPSEACGFLAGPAARASWVDAFQREPNEADKYHALDPETFPRTSRTYFKINELRAGRAFDEGAAAGRPVKVIFHSHCDAGAYFSEEDAATFSSEGVLTWPCAFLVVSVREGVVDDRKLWVHDPATGAFREGELRVAEAAAGP
jgi:proteasome lid subunit RPN8/RPN11